MRKREWGGADRWREIVWARQCEAVRDQCESESENVFRSVRVGARMFFEVREWERIWEREKNRRKEKRRVRVSERERVSEECENE